MLGPDKLLRGLFDDAWCRCDVKWFGIEACGVRIKLPLCRDLAIGPQSASDNLICSTEEVGCRQVNSTEFVCAQMLRLLFSLNDNVGGFATLRVGPAAAAIGVTYVPAYANQQGAGASRAA